MYRTNLFFLGLIALAIVFVACVDDENNVTDVYDDVNQVLASGKELNSVSCDSTSIGKKIFVVDSGASYFCDGRDLILLKGSDGDQGPVGSEGKKGATGDKGVAGDSAQFTGDTGPDGEKGERGDSSNVNCGIARDSAGVVVFKCSDGKESKIYTALCGDSAYDPMDYFCLNGSLYSNAEYFLDARDNQVYRYAVLGRGDSARVWMLENLNYELNDGEQSWCYKNSSLNCEKYGRLYTWAAVLNKPEEECGYGRKCNVANPFKGICPEGWHVSTKEEWKMLFKLEKEKETAGLMLRAADGWSDGVAGTDDLGFSVYPGGYYEEFSFYGEGLKALFWTSNFIDKFTAQTYGMTFDNKDVTYEAMDKDLGLALRCVMD